MRIVFTSSLLLLSVFFTAMAFADLNFLSARGRIAPGFFPQIVGTLLVVFTLYAVIDDYRRRDTEAPVTSDWRVTAGVVTLVAILIVGSHYMGALAGMVIFMLLALSTLNKGRHLTNILVGVVLPVGLFTLFRYTLNASLPPGMLGLPY